MIKRLCCYPACQNFREEGSLYCSEHAAYGQQKEAEKKQHAFEVMSGRRANEGMYNTQRWRTLRTGTIAVHPFCCICGCAGSKDNPLTVDHIWAPRGNEKLFYDPDNLQVLCRNCHNRKTWQEMHERLR